MTLISRLVLRVLLTTVTDLAFSRKKTNAATAIHSFKERKACYLRSAPVLYKATKMFNKLCFL